ncbi:hypothetical protein GCM10027090_11040 [Sinomonas soli]
MVAGVGRVACSVFTGPMCADTPGRLRDMRGHAQQHLSPVRAALVDKGAAPDGSRSLLRPIVCVHVWEASGWRPVLREAIGRPDAFRAPRRSCPAEWSIGQKAPTSTPILGGT